MAVQENAFDYSQILQPAFAEPYMSLLSPATFGPSLTITRGQAMARKVSDGKFYPLNVSASDGTQTFGGFAQYTCTTDAGGNVSVGSINSVVTLPTQYTNIYTSGIFNPENLLTSTNTATQVDTITPSGTITVGDVYSLTSILRGTATTVSFTATATTVANVAAGLVAAWNANPNTANTATASNGSTAIVLTATAANTILNESPSVVGTGVLTKVVTTAAGGRALADITPGAPGSRVHQPTGFWLIQ